MWSLAGACGLQQHGASVGNTFFALECRCASQTDLGSAVSHFACWGHDLHRRGLVSRGEV